MGHSQSREVGGDSSSRNNRHSSPPTTAISTVADAVSTSLGRRRRRQESCSSNDSHQGGNLGRDGQTDSVAESSEQSSVRHRQKRRLSLGTSLGIGRSSRRPRTEAAQGAHSSQAGSSATDSDNMMQVDQPAASSEPSVPTPPPAMSLPQVAVSSSDLETPASSADRPSDSPDTSFSDQDPFRHLWHSARPTAHQSTEDQAAGNGETGTPPPHLDSLVEERNRARRQIEQVLGPSASGISRRASSQSLPFASGSARPAESNRPTSPLPSPPVPSSTLAALLGEVLGMRRPEPESETAAATSPAAGSNAQASTNGTSQSPSDATQQPRDSGAQGSGTGPAPMPPNPMSMSGTSVIVQGALIARTLPSRRSREDSAASTSDRGQNNATDSGSPASVLGHSSAGGQSSQFDRIRTSMSSTRRHGTQGSVTSGRTTFRRSQAADGGMGNLRMGEGEEPQAATLEEQAAMLSRILGIATAATAASLVNPTSSQMADRALLQSTLQPAVESMASRPRPGGDQGSANTSAAAAAAAASSPSAASSLSPWRSRSNAPAPPILAPPSSSLGLGQGLRDRLAAFSQRARSVSGSARQSNAAEARTGAEGQTTESQEAARTLLRRYRSDGGAQAANRDASASTASETASSSSSTSSRSSWSRLMREAARQLVEAAASRTVERGQSNPAAGSDSNSGSGSTAAQSGSAEPVRPDGYSTGPNDVAGPLRQVREGLPLPEGEPGSFGSFLHHLLHDLSVAVQSIRPPEPERATTNAGTTSDYFERASETQATNGAEILDGEGGRSGDGADATQTRASPSATGTDSESAPDAEARARREGDVQGGQLSFFRLFRFDPVAPSTLVPCVVVGVRSVGVTETLHAEAGTVRPGATASESARAAAGTHAGAGAGAAATAAAAAAAGYDTNTAPTASVGSETGPASTTDGVGDSYDGNAGGNGGSRLPASRFLLFVSGGRYPENHPLLTANPSAAGRDLMLLMELLGTMANVQPKPSTVTQAEIDGSELRKIKGSEVAELTREGKIKENTAERCLVCLEDWNDEDECRLLACQHVFHAPCVDRWMTNSSNSCPMCRRQGVSKDGARAGDETAESRASGGQQPQPQPQPQHAAGGEPGGGGAGAGAGASGLGGLF